MIPSLDFEKYLFFIPCTSITTLLVDFISTLWKILCTFINVSYPRPLYDQL